MGQLARAQVVQSKRAFAERDVAHAEDLVRQDQEINQLQRECFKLALDIGDDVDRREWAMHMTLVARALERIGGNAVDIGEQTALSSPVSSASSPIPRGEPDARRRRFY